MQDIYAKRRDKVRALMRKQGLDALLVRYAANRYYLSGFELHDVQFNESSGSLIIASSGEDYLATDPRYMDVAQTLWPKERLVIYRNNMPEVLTSILRKVGVSVGLEVDALSQSFWNELCKEKGFLSFVPVRGLVEEVRSIKDATEIKALEQSFALNHAMLSWLEAQVEPGLSEMDVSWQIERYFREHGASELAFPSIVAVNEHAARPHAIPDATKIQKESLLLIDVGCRVADYCSDQTRTFWIGEHPSSRYLDTVALVRQAQERAIKMMRPGVTLGSCYEAARDVFLEAGVADSFTHGLGHGVGLETHELPSLGPKRSAKLQEGMIVTVEPGLYFPDWGGVRIEHTVVVEKNSVRIL
ncbi:MAG: aminopeptidase P family protein [Desulfovibrionaceae bacterium]|nr:aminopeptidase P family protein [Desulfovibrionaceae bacterium]